MSTTMPDAALEERRRHVLRRRLHHGGDFFLKGLELSCTKNVVFLLIVRGRATPHWWQAVFVSVCEQFQQKHSPTDHPGKTQNIKDALEVAEGERWGSIVPSRSTSGTIAQVELDPLHVFNLRRKHIKLSVSTYEC